MFAKRVSGIFVLSSPFFYDQFADIHVINYPHDSSLKYLQSTWAT